MVCERNDSERKLDDNETRRGPVVVGCSLGSRSSSVAAVGLDLAARMGSRAELVHSDTHLELQPGSAASDVSRHELTRRVLDLVDPSDRVDRDGVGAHVSKSGASAAISDVSAAVDASLVVIGPHEVSALRRAMVGSTVAGLASEGRWPLLVVHSQSRPLPERALVAVDGSTFSMQALTLLRRLQHDLGVDGSLRVIGSRRGGRASKAADPLPTDPRLDTVEDFERLLARHSVTGDVSCDLVEGPLLEAVERERDAWRPDWLVLSMPERDARVDERTLTGREVLKLTALSDDCNVLIVPAATAWITESAQETP